MTRKIRTLSGAVGLAAVLALAGCAKPVSAPTVAEPTVAEPSRAQPEAASPARRPSPDSVSAQKWMISAANPYAAEAGREILRAGGSAVDAAIAAAMVLGLVEPQSSGLGGGGFLLHGDGKSGDIAAYDGRETAPSGANPYMFLGANGDPRPFMEAVVGGLSVGVPGLLRMLEMAHKEHGRLPWADLFQPAIRLARDGFKVSQRLAALIAKDKYLNTFAPTAAYFTLADGRPLPEGHILKNPALAETLSLIAEFGSVALYSGPLAAAIAATVAEAAINPGFLTAADLKNYRAVRRDPVCLFYRQWLVCGMGPPSSGGITSLQILGILQSFDMAAMAPGEAGGIDPQAAHLLAEASRLAFADRNTYIADPEFVPVPVDGMLDPGYLALRAEEISPERANGPAAPGMPGLGGAWNFAPGGEGPGISTTHLSVIDGDGNAVSMTTSIESAFGSRLMAGGFLLNNQLTDFSFAANDRDGGPIANRAEAGKRPRSSMAPTIVFDGDGKAVLAIGSPGGSRIIGYVTQALIAALDWNQDIQKALDQGHVVNRNGASELEQGSEAEALKGELEGRGHEVRIVPMTSGLHAVRVRGDRLTGGADVRREGVALGD